MKRILSVHRSWFMALGLTAGVLVLTRWLPDHDGSRGDYGLAGAAAERGDADLDAAPARPAPRRRASATKPDFSVSQSQPSRG
jgi:hypothetical protein